MTAEFNATIHHLDPQVVANFYKYKHNATLGNVDEIFRGRSIPASGCHRILDCWNRSEDASIILHGTPDDYGYNEHDEFNLDDMFGPNVCVGDMITFSGYHFGFICLNGGNWRVVTLCDGYNSHNFYKLQYFSCVGLEFYRPALAA